VYFRPKNKIIYISLLEINLDSIKINTYIWRLIFIKHIKMNKGTVKFFNVSKGFGFIKDADSNNEYFVHVSGLKDQIKENDVVTFELAEGKKGINAVNVKLA
jgi:cold shock protein